MKAFVGTPALLRNLVRRDWGLLLVWLLAVLAFAASGAGKFEAALSTARLRSSMFVLFRNPAMIALFGPPAAHVTTASIGIIFGQTMTLLTSVTFAVVSIIYVVDRTRKQEDEGVTELLRSLQVGRLASTTAVVIELLALQLVIVAALAGSIQAQHVPTMSVFSDNLLFAAVIGAQGLLWGAVALVCAQIFPEASTSKGAAFTVLAALYILRMATDIKDVSLGRWNPLSWSYLTWVYVDNDWLPVTATVALSALLLAGSYVLELNRDISSGYVSARDGSAHASRGLRSLPGLVLREERGVLVGWLIALSVLGVMYGSMFAQIGTFLKDSTGLMKQLLSVPGYRTSLVNQYLVMILALGAVAVSCLGVMLFSRMVREERHSRQELLYAKPLGRNAVYLTYLGVAVLSSVLAEFVFSASIWLAQSRDADALAFVVVLRSGFVYLPAIVFVLGLQALSVGFAPRWSGAVWVYLGFSFLMSYVGKVLEFPDWVKNVSVFHAIPELPVASMDWPHVVVVAVLSVCLLAVGLLRYRRRDLISG